MLAQVQQFEACNRLTAFLMHDLKDLAAQQSLIVENAERHRDNPEFIDDALDTISGGVQRMRRVLDHLRQTSAAQSVSRVELGKLMLQTVSQRHYRNPTPHCVIVDRQVWVQGDPDRLSMAVIHAIRNAQDATPGEGTIEVVQEEDENAVTTKIIDTGVGMDDAFVMERLFRPFNCTKGTQGVGIGAHWIKKTIQSLGGRLHVRSKPGLGTELTFLLKAVPGKV